MEQDHANGNLPSLNIDGVTVSVTGTLSISRDEAIAKINGTNARYVTRVAGTTDYLIAARFDTAKAKNAAVMGVQILDEAEFVKMVESGCFPARANSNTFTPKKRVSTESWDEWYDPERLCLLKYTDFSGAESSRFIYLACAGKWGNGHEYIGAYDIGEFKTFRRDRIISLEEL